MLTTKASWNDRVQKEGEFKQQRPGNTQHGVSVLCQGYENKEDAGDRDLYLICSQPFNVTSSGKPSLISHNGVIISFLPSSIHCVRFPIVLLFGEF